MNKDEKVIVEVSYGLASSYGRIIEINKKLKENPALRQKILNHELRHSNGSRYNVQDFKTDFRSESSYFFESVKFCVYHPDCFINFFPFMYSYYFKEWSFNLSACFPFVILGLMFATFFKLTLGISFFACLGVFTLWIGIMNLVFLYLTKEAVKEDRI